jgi:hypothetical protein
MTANLPPAALALLLGAAGAGPRRHTAMRRRGGCRRVLSGAARVQPRERLVRGAAARAGVEVRTCVPGLGGRRPVRGQPREPRRVPRAPVAGEVRQQLAVDRCVRALEQPRVLAMGDPEGGDDLVGRAFLQPAHRPRRAGPPLDREQDVLTISATSRRSTCSLTDGLRSAIASIPLPPVPSAVAVISSYDVAG